MENPSLAKGAPLTAASWADFTKRLHHDCRGEGVRDHGTADVIFLVEALRRQTGMDYENADKRMIHDNDGGEWFSPQAYWDHLVDHEYDEDRATLDDDARETFSYRDRPPADFLSLDDSDRWAVLEEVNLDITVTGYIERWDFVNAHLTKDAAEAFIARKKHDYPDGLRVMADAQTYCWEFDAIKQGILNGTIVFKEPAPC